MCPRISKDRVPLCSTERSCRSYLALGEKSEGREELKKIAEDFNDSGISGELSENIRQDALEKDSPMYPRSVLQAFTIMPQRQIFREGRGREGVQGDDPRDHSVGGGDGGSV